MKEETINGNKLIAKYMNKKVLEGDDYAKYVGCPENELYNMPPNNLFYHSDWSEIMPVIVKIIFDDYGSLTIRRPMFVLSTDNHTIVKRFKTNFTGGVESVPIEILWECIVDYLKLKSKI